MNWNDVEEYAAKNGMSVQAAAQALGMKVENKLNSAAEALKRLYNPPVPPDSPDRFKAAPVMQDRNDATLANQGAYEKNLNQKARQAAEAEQQSMDKMDNFDDSGYTNYSDGGKVERFSNLRHAMNQPQGKATAELDASKDPMGYIKKNRSMSIKNKKGIAF